MSNYKFKGKYIRRTRLIVAALAILLMIVFFGNFDSFVLKMYYPMKYNDLVDKYSERYSVDPFWIFAIIKAESDFDTNAESRKHAMGLMQITSDTGRWAAEKFNLVDFKNEYLFEPELNIRIGSWYFANLKKEFGNNIELALAAYNGGSGNVHRWLDRNIISDKQDIVSSIPFKETREYVKKVKKHYMQYRKLYENKNR